jgi:Lon protease-like protein
MTDRLFTTTFETLPGDLPIFPLTGVVLLPRGKLPLNIFEPRYLALVEDALSSNRLIGMVQPSDSGRTSRNPAIFPLGCAGRISQFAETDDGRILITLTGVCRFAITQELEPRRGYRRVVPNWASYYEDCDPEPPSGAVDRTRLITGLRTYFKLQELSANWDAIEATPDDRLITSLAMICPFGPTEKQALLEAKDLEERARALIALIEMAVLEGGTAEGARH